MTKPKKVLNDSEAQQLMWDLDEPPDEKHINELYQKYLRGERLDPIQEMLLMAAGKIRSSVSGPSQKKTAG